jgi:hypothetical protein
MNDVGLKAVVTIPEGTAEDWAELLENARWTRRQADRTIARLGRIEMMLGALCWYLLPASGANRSPQVKGHADRCQRATSTACR